MSLVSVFVKLSGRAPLQRQVEREWSVGELRAYLQSELSASASQKLRLIHGGHVLQDHESLDGLSSGDDAPLVIDAVLTNESAASAASARPPAGPSMREQMRAMAGNPMMRALLSNPASLRALLHMNPQLQAVMASNPDVAALLNSDSMMRNIADSILNPDARSHDRALANIESLPGGSAALARAWQQVAEPMLDGMAPPVAASDESSAPIDENAPFPNAWQPPAAPAVLAPPSLLAAHPFAALFQQQTLQTQRARAEQEYSAQLALLADMGFDASASEHARNLDALIAERGDVDAAVLRIDEQLQRREAQLVQLAELGFTDRDKCVRALELTRGDVDAAADFLISSAQTQ